MKKVSIFIFLLIFQLSLLAQEKVSGVVNYGQKQSFGMGAPIGIDYNAELVFDFESSTYTVSKDSLEGGHVKKMELINKNDEHAFFVPKATTQDGFLYNINLETGFIKSRDVGFNYVKDSIPKIKWKILKETKEIGSFVCVKAICNFRGRDYTAWFSLDIPLPYGPWKLQGLPGLILEAYDTDKEIFFYFKSIEYPSAGKRKIIVPNPKTNIDMERGKPTLEREWISFQEFRKEMLKRHAASTKMGKVFMAQMENVHKAENKNPMKNFYIEIFDEE
ncbi:hypothetical protein GCM10011531_06890 [Aquaticitalea lipolytica]|uniref:GLPGLI family protein n=1 Tax=Aquaticitalea lipolytica TaxID=1247562 RepID=A0A8J2TMT0_9FLAO|nr:GLPGLI family protein [Aquaticitalea lipolytica]GFZ79627.1 hypothetical protein GCM10011531_06890 [Aquaticitalea lipolytica]